MQSINSELIDKKEVISNVKLYWQRPASSIHSSPSNDSPDSQRPCNTCTNSSVQPCHYMGNLVITCCNVKIVIDRLTGLPCLISKDGVNILADANILDSAYAPCRVQLHRAPVDNDRIGYSSRWEALGLDKQLMYIPNNDVIDDVSKDNEEFNGTINTEYCTYHRLPRLIDGSEGFEVKWRMKPSHINVWKIEYIKSITSFYDSDEYTHMDVSVNSYEEEVYVYHLCSIHQLAWDTILVDSSTQKASIKIWKLNLNMCTTIKKATRSPPLLPPNHSKEPSNSENNEHNLYPISWCVTYYMSITGKLSMNITCDLNELSFIPIPRVGIQLQLHPRMKGVLWSGCGPHECYNDRKYSTVNAIHQTSIDSLHVPYIRPSENGNRCDIDWLQISSDIYYNDKSSDESVDNNNNSDHLSASTSSSSLTPESFNQNDNNKIEINQTDFNSDDDSVIDGGDGVIDDKISCRFHSSKLFNFSAQYYTTEDLMQIPNSKDLETFKRKFISLNIDGYLMGIGGDDSWTASVHEEYLLKHKQVYNFDVIVDFI